MSQVRLRSHQAHCTRGPAAQISFSVVWPLSMAVRTLRLYIHDEEARDVEKTQSALAPCGGERRKTFPDGDLRLELEQFRNTRRLFESVERCRFLEENGTFATCFRCRPIPKLPYRLRKNSNVSWNPEIAFLQGLKPSRFCGTCGTTKVVPCYKTKQWAGFSAACIAPTCPVQDRKKFRARNRTFAGRSASRRMKYGYQSVPNGT